MSVFPTCAAIFQANHKHKRPYAINPSDKMISVGQIFGINEKFSDKGGKNTMQIICLGPKEDFCIGLTKSGQVYIWGDFAMSIDAVKDKIGNNQPMKKLCEYAPQLLTYEGTLYGWGDDSQNRYGILGLGEQYKAVRPYPNNSLFDYMIKSLSLTETHACALDSNGRLFCWGYGPNGELGFESLNNTVNTPTMIIKQKQINIKKAICHNTYTAFCSGNIIRLIINIGAGYVFLFGSLQNSITMCQIMSLNETFITDIVGGDSFLVCTTSCGDMYFVDDSLESVQINVCSIDSVAVAGSKIIGLDKNNRIFEWSTAGLNKLSFNKENKLLLRQDFQIKEYLIKSEFSQNIKLVNLCNSTLNAALIFEDISNIQQKFAKLHNQEQEPNLIIPSQQEQIIIAELVIQTNKQSHFNPMTSESSFLTSQEDNALQPQKDMSPSSFINETTPDVSITNTQQDQIQPSFKITEENQIEEFTMPSNFLTEKDINNIFNYQGINTIQADQQTLNQNQIVNNHQHQPSFQFLQTTMNPNQFFFENENTQNNAPSYRPSSIKSYKQTSSKSCSPQYNSSPSLKQCAADMQPLGYRNSKIEISFPSFLNVSNDRNCQKDRSSSKNKQETNNNEDQIEFSIKLFPNQQPTDQSLHYSDHESRGTSIVRQQTENEEGKLEEEMTITMDSFQIQTKRTTTPKKLLNSYSQSKRSIISITPSDQNPILMNQQESNFKSQHSQQTELSNEFNLTTVQSNYDGRNTIFSQTGKDFIPQHQTQFQQYQKEQQKKQYHRKKLSNSCGSNGTRKKTSFIQAVLQQQNKKPTFDISQNPQSVTQIYNAPPLGTEPNNIDQKMNNDITQSKISEEDPNLMMSSSSNNTNNASKQQQPSIFYIYGNQSQNNDIQGRNTIGVTQTDDNFEVDYSVSNSCTPQSNQSIKRRINFDDASGEAGAIIKMSENDMNSKFISTFRISNTQTNPNEKMKVALKLSNGSFQNQSEPFQSMIFNQCQSPQAVQPFNEGENPMSDIRSNSTPNHHGNTTHIMMLTEEKFKNLKTEISQVENQNQFLLTQNTLLSPNDFNLNKVDSRSLLIGCGGFQNQSNIQNLSSFIKQSKYLQVYENYRRGFQSLSKLNDLRKTYAIRKLKKYTLDEKQRKEFVYGMARFLFNTLKTHITNQKQVGFKRIKKFFKERQLQVYIRQKQNEFAFKSKLLSKVDTIIVRHNNEMIKLGIESIKSHYQRLMKQIQGKKNKGTIQLFNLINRKSKQLQEKSLRAITNWVNEKKIIEMNLKMLVRVLSKFAIKHKRTNFKFMQEGLFVIEKRQQAINRLSMILLKKNFNLFRAHIQMKKCESQCITKICEILSNKSIRSQLTKGFHYLKANALKQRGVNNLIQIHKRIMMINSFKKFKKSTQFKINKEKQLKVQKALLLLMFSKVGDIIKSNLRTGFHSIFKQAFADDTFLINKSHANSNLSFTLNQLLNDPSLIMQSRDRIVNSAYYSSRNNAVSKSLNKSNSQGISKQNYLSNQVLKDAKFHGQTTKHNLNDYLSFSPQDADIKIANKFLNRRGTETAIPNSKQFQPQRVDKNYLNSALPLSIHQERQAKKQLSIKEISNVSIKDINQAFREQVSRIKIREQQDESDRSKSFNSYGNYCGQQQQLHIEISQTPEQLIVGEQIKVNKSPRINPLCTSESYTAIQGYNQQSQDGGIQQNQYASKQNAQVKHSQKLMIEQDDDPYQMLNENVLESNEEKVIQINLTDYQRKSCPDSDFSMDFEQSHDMFDEFEYEEREQKLHRLHSTQNIGLSYVKSSIADLSKRMDDYYQEEQISSIIQYQQPLITDQKYEEQELASPKFNESFIPPFSREVFNEMAANYQMELTPEADLHMLLNNKSSFKPEESMYSTNQYADPAELTLSPRINPLGAHQTVQTQVNYYVSTIQSQPNEMESEQSDELSQLIENGRDSRPYDFELSSNSKFKIISENQQVKNILKSETAQPSMIVQHNQGICKKLSFGYELNQRNANNKTNQRNTLILSGDDQTINFNLTEEECKFSDDEELDVGEEIPTEKRSKRNLALPESRIMEQDLDRKNSVRLSHNDLCMIAQNRMHKLNSTINQQLKRESSKGKKNLTNDFISQNIDRLRNITKLSPRYEIGESQISSVASSTRNLNQRSFGFGSNKTNPQKSFESTQKSFTLGQQSNPKRQPSNSYIIASSTASNRNQSKENSYNNLRDSAASNQQRNNSKGCYKPLTSRGNQNFVQSSVQWTKGMMDRRISCEQEVYMSQQDLKGSTSQRNLQPSKSRNMQEKLTTFLTIGNHVMNQSSFHGINQPKNSSNSINMRHI